MSNEKSLVRSSKAFSAANLLENNYKSISKQQK